MPRIVWPTATKPRLAPRLAAKRRCEVRLGLPRSDGHPRSAEKAGKECPSWRPWNGREGQESCPRQSPKGEGDPVARPGGGVSWAEGGRTSCCRGRRGRGRRGGLAPASAR